LTGGAGAWPRRHTGFCGLPLITESRPFTSLTLPYSFTRKWPDMHLCGSPWDCPGRASGL